jgi:hypothetical protein
VYAIDFMFCAVGEDQITVLPGPEVHFGIQKITSFMKHLHG